MIKQRTETSTGRIVKEEKASIGKGAGNST